ncbi:hypothetical protein KBD71_04495 [Candidatus Woesebacteria bacterium]|nr:hypothetical protein [Candidatus Woesebacteria bacterium]
MGVGTVVGGAVTTGVAMTSIPHLLVALSQKPDWHWDPLLHADPFGLGVGFALGVETGATGTDAHLFNAGSQYPD